MMMIMTKKRKKKNSLYIDSLSLCVCNELYRWEREREKGGAAFTFTYSIRELVIRAPSAVNGNEIQPDRLLLLLFNGIKGNKTITCR